MVSSLEVMTPVIECMYDCQEFMIVNVIVPFSGREGLGEIGAGMKVTITILLHEYPSAGKEGSICHDNEQLLDIREVQDWSSLEVGEQGGKGGLLGGSPCPGGVLLSESSERCDNIQETRDELPIEVAETEESVNGLDGLWWRPSCDGR